jgi:type II secretion system protein G
MFQFFSRRLRNERGFTLIELLIVVAIIAILAAILIPNFLRARAQSQVAASKGNLKNVATALESYFVDAAAYPQASTALEPDYTRARPRDPCTGANFDVSPGYSYAVTSNPATDYTLRSNWGSTTGSAGYPCYQANGNANIIYTPGGGLQSTSP